MKMKIQKNVFPGIIVVEESSGGSLRETTYINRDEVLNSKQYKNLLSKIERIKDLMDECFQELFEIEQSVPRATDKSTIGNLTELVKENISPEELLRKYIGIQ
jgi:hypothetical protein